MKCLRSPVGLEDHPEELLSYIFAHLKVSRKSTYPSHQGISPPDLDDPDDVESIESLEDPPEETEHLGENRWRIRALSPLFVSRQRRMYLRICQPVTNGNPNAPIQFLQTVLQRR